MSARAATYAWRSKDKLKGIGSFYITWVSGTAAGAFTRGLDPVLTGRGGWGGGGGRQKGTDGDRAQHFGVASAGARGVRPAHQAAEGPREDGGGQARGLEAERESRRPGFC